MDGWCGNLGSVENVCAFTWQTFYLFRFGELYNQDMISLNPLVAARKVWPSTYDELGISNLDRIKLFIIRIKNSALKMGGSISSHRLLFINKRKWQIQNWLVLFSTPERTFRVIQLYINFRIGFAELSSITLTPLDSFDDILQLSSMERISAGSFLWQK